MNAETRNRIQTKDVSNKAQEIKWKYQEKDAFAEHMLKRCGNHGADQEDKAD